MNWYAVYTKPRWEKKVALKLEALNYNTYCPITKEKKQWSDRVKVVERLILPSYVFVQLRQNQLSEIRYINGIVNFVYDQTKPAIIKSAEIVALKKFVDKYTNQHIEIGNIKQGQIIEIENKQLGKQRAEVLAVKNKKVEVLLTSLGIKLVVTLKPNKIEIDEQN